jgi:ribose transport system substrate-binding protein
MRFVAVIAAVALITAGCGSSSSSSSSTAAASATPAASTSNQGLAEAKAAVAKLEAAPPPIQLPRLTKRPPTGKTVVLVSCPIPGCKLAESSVIPAAQLLGWHVKVLNAGLTPEAYVAAAEQALQLNPDYIIFTALQPDKTIQTQLNQAQARHIPVASFASSDPPGSGMTATIFGQHTLRALGVGLAQWVTAASNAHANILYLHDPSAATWAQSDATFNATMTKLCSGCHVHQLQISDLQIGQSIPQQVITYLQQNPSTQYIVTAFSAVLTGVPAALKAAGLDKKVRLASATGTPADYALTVANDPSYTILAAEQEGGYRALDVFARLSVGASIATCCTDPALYEQLLTKVNINSFNNKQEWGVPNLAQTFANYWHVSVPAGFKTLQGVGG